MYQQQILNDKIKMSLTVMLQIKVVRKKDIMKDGQTSMPKEIT